MWDEPMRTSILSVFAMFVLIKLCFNSMGVSLRYWLFSFRYVAIADILDLSLVEPLVKLVDLRIFIRLWCGVDILSACSGSLCKSLAAHSSTWGTLESCGRFLSRPDEIHGSCVYGVNEDCRTTIWVHKLRSAQRNQSLWNSKAAAVGSTNNVIREKYSWRSHKQIAEDLGIGSEAGKYEVLSFGSLFSSEYKGSQLHVDIESSEDRKVRALVEAMKFIPFTSPIVNAGKLYAKQRIKKPYFCAQMRLLDGQFKNHWEKTFIGLKTQLRVAQERQNWTQVLNVFVMTDLPRSKWNDTYLGELIVDDSYKVHTLNGTDPMIQQTAIELAEGDYGLRSGYFPPHNKTMNIEVEDPDSVSVHPDILLFVEEVICGCASLGFAGTSGSTLSASILQLRSGITCATNSAHSNA
ncbi:hypothetical protein L7F22_057503 [Adiantum nelumboides]|nr:hypothetical protein [Adiantum nelumboides]